MNTRSSPLDLLRAVDWNRFVAEHITRSPLLTLWLMALTAFTVSTIVQRLQAAPVSSMVVVIVWAVTVVSTVFSELRHKHTVVTWWLRNNLYNSITNILITVVLVLGILSVLFGLYRYAWETASFDTVPTTQRRAINPERRADDYCFTVGALDNTADEPAIVEGEMRCFPLSRQTTDVSLADIGREAVRVCFDERPTDVENGETCFESSVNNPDFFTVTDQFSGANWGAVSANMTTLMVFRYHRAEMWRVYASVVLVVVLLIPTQVVYRESFPNKWLRNGVTALWLLSPIIIFVLLRGVEPPPFETGSAGQVVRGLAGELFGWEMAFLGNNLVNTLLMVGAAALFIWLSLWITERGKAAAQNVSTWRTLSIVVDLLTIAAVGFAAYRLYDMLLPLFQANFNILSLILFILFAVTYWLWNRQFPFIEGETGWRATVRTILRWGMIVFGVMLAYTVVKLAGYLLGSLNWSTIAFLKPIIDFVSGSFWIVLLRLLLTGLVIAGVWYFVSRNALSWNKTARLIIYVVIGILAFLLAAVVIVWILYFAGMQPTEDGTRPLLGYVDPAVNWGGFLLTIVITVFAIVVSFPLGLVLALGRRSKIRGIPAWLTYGVALIIMVWGLITSTPDNLLAARNTFERVLAYWPIAVPILAYFFQRSFNGNVVAAFSTLYIEFIRGIPLIAVLFLTITLFPILLPPGVEILNTWRVLWGFALFSAAYLAENVRGGLQAIPNGQYEAADSLGLNTYDKYRLIILPQAIRIVIPAIVGQFIGLFKDTTLVAIVGLLDILGVANAISAQPQWLGVRREAYLFLAALYFVGSAIMVAYSRRLEKRMGLGER